MIIINTFKVIKGKDEPKQKLLHHQNSGKCGKCGKVSHFIRKVATNVV